MNCLYITLFFNTVAGIVQTFIESWNQLLYPRVIEVCYLSFELCRNFLLHLIRQKGKENEGIFFIYFILFYFILL